MFAPARSLSGLLWIGGPAPVAAAACGVSSIGSPVDGADEGGTEEERTGSFRVLPGASVAPDMPVFLDGGSARPLISRGGTGGREKKGNGRGAAGVEGAGFAFFFSPSFFFSCLVLFYLPFSSSLLLGKRWNRGVDE